MRHIVYPIMAVAALGLVTACHNEQDFDIPKDSDGRMIIVHASQAAKTRTTIIECLDEDNNLFYKSIWQAGDQIRLFQVCSHTWEVDSSSELDHDADAITDFQVPSFMDYHQPDSDEQVQYVGVSFGKYISYVDYGDKIWMDAWGDNPSSTWGLDASISSFQRPTEDSFDRDADLLLSKMVTSNSGPLYEMDLFFARVGSIAKITLKNLPKGEKVKSGILEAGESWMTSAEVVYDPTVEKVVYLPLSVKGSDESVSLIEFEPVDVYVDQSGQAVIWLRTTSGTLKDHFTISVDTENPETGKVTTFEKEVDLTSYDPVRSITFDEGSITAFNVVMEKSPIFKFDQETLELFPELGDKQHPRLRLPRDYNGFIPIVISSPYIWEMSLEFDKEEEDWFGFMSSGWNSYYVNTFYEGYSPLYLRKAQMILSCPDLESVDEDYQPIVIPVEEYQIVTVVKNNEVLWNGDWLKLSVGESIELSAHIQCPSWLSFDETPIDWVYVPEDHSVEVDADGLTCTVTGVGAGDDRVSIRFAGYDLLWEESLTGQQAQWLGFYGPEEIFLDYDGMDVTGKTITVGPGEEFTLRADLSGLAEKEIADADWIVYSDYDWDVEPPVEIGSDFLQYTKNNTYPNYSINIKAGDEYGYDRICLSIKLNDAEETEVFLDCDVFVSPIRISKNGVNVTGKEIKVAPGDNTDLTVVVDNAFVQMLEAESIEIGPVHWCVYYGGEKDDEGDYIPGTGNPISLTFEPENPYTATVSAKRNPTDSYDRVLCQIEIGGEYWDCDCDFVVATPYPIPTPSKMRRTASNRRHVNDQIYQFNHFFNRHLPN